MEKVYCRFLPLKFTKKIYSSWFSNFLTNVNNFNLVLYTDNNSIRLLMPFIKNNKRIKVVFLPIHLFYNFKYKDRWVKNQKDNIYLSCI